MHKTKTKKKVRWIEETRHQPSQAPNRLKGEKGGNDQKNPQQIGQKKKDNDKNLPLYRV